MKNETSGNIEKKDNYISSIHLIGRIGSIGALACMLGIPALMCLRYDMFPSISDLLMFGGGLLAMYVPLAIAEFVAFVPMLGSASYLAMITGNVSNIKLPCALTALEIADVEQNTDAGDAVSTVAVAISSLVTVGILILGVVLARSIQPVFQNPTVKLASGFMMPALYGCLFLSQLMSAPGGVVVKGRVKCLVLPIIVIILLNIFVKNFNLGLGILICIPITILSSWILYKSGQIKVVRENETK